MDVEVDPSPATGSCHGINERETIEHLMSIWPISSNIAVHLPVGDLISLSRASTALRAYTHNFPHNSNGTRSSPYESLSPSDRATSSQHLHVGKHQTPHWTNLKSLAPFVCSFPSHRDPKSASLNPCGACKYCSRPICKICIVRSFFMDPKTSKETYRYRTRHLCPDCWLTGNMRKDYRFPTNSVSRDQVWKGRGYGQRGHWCACSATENNWVCGECRILQNASGYQNLALSEVLPPSPTTNKQRDTGELKQVRCYGLDCDVVISEVDRDRRRICLWCSKPLMRQFGGEDRLRWEEKQVEIRAASAASRSADIKEWARNRFRNLTMSRREMRGTAACIELTGSDGPEHDKPIFVRHLDAINYRKYMSDSASPSPDSVYKSKQGRWTYSLRFLLRVRDAANIEKMPTPASIDADTLFEVTKRGGLQKARRNMEFHPMSWDPIIAYATQLKEADLLGKDSLDWMLHPRNRHREEMTKLRDILFDHLRVWENLPEDVLPYWRGPSFQTMVLASGFSEYCPIKDYNTDIDQHVVNTNGTRTRQETFPAAPSAEAEHNPETGHASKGKQIATDEDEDLLGDSDSEGDGRADPDEDTLSSWDMDFECEHELTQENINNEPGMGGSRKDGSANLK